MVVSRAVTAAILEFVFAISCTVGTDMCARKSRHCLTWDALANARTVLARQAVLAVIQLLEAFVIARPLSHTQPEFTLARLRAPSVVVVHHASGE